MERVSWRIGVVAALILVQGCSPQLDRGSSQAPNAPSKPLSATSADAAPLDQTATLALLESDHFDELDRHFSALQKAYEKGQLDDVSLRAAFRVFYATDAGLEPKYDAWVSRFPKSYVARLARGIYYKKIALERRGGKYIAATKPAQIAAMESFFAKAAKDLSASIDLSPKPLLSYLHAMDVTAYEGEEDETRELFEHALQVDPGNFIAREKYMGYLEPRWGGSVNQMNDFLNDCRKAGLSAAHLRLLEAIIVADEAQKYKDEGNYAAAERDYRKAIEMGRDDCSSCLAEVLIQENKFADAIAVYSKVLQKTPQDAATLVDRAFAYRSIGNIQAAIADWTAAANLGNPYAQNQLGVAYMTGQGGIVPLDPKAGIAWFRKAAAQGNATAIQNLARALQLAPDAAK